MCLSENLRAWKKNLTTRTSAEYVLTLRSDINCFADEAERLESEIAELRELVKALVAVADLIDCDECPCQYTPDCIECDEAIPILMMRELGIEVKDEH